MFRLKTRRRMTNVGSLQKCSQQAGVGNGGCSYRRLLVRCADIPSITQHIDRFGRYNLEVDDRPSDLEEALFMDAWLPTGRAAVISERLIRIEAPVVPENDDAAEQLTFERWPRD